MTPQLTDRSVRADRSVAFRGHHTNLGRIEPRPLTEWQHPSMKTYLASTAAILILSACGHPSDIDSPNASMPSPASSPSSSSTSSTDPTLIDYGEDGISLQKTSDVDKLVGAPDDFKTFIAGVVEKVTAGSDPSDQCAPTVGVGLIDPAGFASGGISDCGGAAIIWARKDGAWKQIWAAKCNPTATR